MADRATSAPAAKTDRPAGATNGPLLGVNNIEVDNDHVILVLKGVSLEVSAGGGQQTCAIGRA